MVCTRVWHAISMWLFFTLFRHFNYVLIYGFRNVIIQPYLNKRFCLKNFTGYSTPQLLIVHFYSWCNGICHVILVSLHYICKHTKYPIYWTIIYMIEGLILAVRGIHMSLVRISNMVVKMFWEVDHVRAGI